MASYLERLAVRTAAVGTVLCVGVDPHPDSLPPGFDRDVRGIEGFARLLVEATTEHAAAFKLNLAFFEAFGSEGMAALERVRAAIPDGIPVIGDAKRGDIGSTAERHAVALFDGLGFDAITVSPYLGVEAIRPLVERIDRFAYVLCRTSNAGGAELQGLEVAADVERGAPPEPLYARVARLATGWGPGATVGLVVGATAPAELAEIRAVAPGLAFLVPGVGAQGGDVAAVREHGFATSGPASGRTGGGLLVNVSRGIAAAALNDRAGDRGTDPSRRLAEAAAGWAARLPVLL